MYVLPFIIFIDFYVVHSIQDDIIILAVKVS